MPRSGFLDGAHQYQTHIKPVAGVHDITSCSLPSSFRAGETTDSARAPLESFGETTASERGSETCAGDNHFVSRDILQLRHKGVRNRREYGALAVLDCCYRHSADHALAGDVFTVG